jgi:hypothetical protein
MRLRCDRDGWRLRVIPQIGLDPEQALGETPQPGLMALIGAPSYLCTPMRYFSFFSFARK